ncbi:MAG TPA: heme-binding protein [Rudaea sp.]|nr:heme-binding protein [Rudaea sp.]
MKLVLTLGVAALCLTAIPASVSADQPTLLPQPAPTGCGLLPGEGALTLALLGAVGEETSGLDFQMWGTIVDRDGIVCAVSFSGADRGSQWPGSRVISAQKANTANAFSLDNLALSTANLYSAVQPGGSLYGLQASNPVDTGVAYKGPSGLYGTGQDPMIGNKIGGVNVFGGGLALYDATGRVVGAVGVSGDTSCADHMIAWRVRNALHLDYLFGKGVSGDADRPDNIIYDITDGASASGFGHPTCINTGPAATLPAVQSVK